MVNDRDPQVGMWTIDLSASHFKTSQPPASQTVSIVPHGNDGVKVTVETVTGNRATSTIEYACQYDGRENPRKEIPNPVLVQTVSVKRIDSHTAERTTYAGGKQLITEKWHISADGKTRTVTHSGVDPAGKPVDNVVVYVRQ